MGSFGLGRRPRLLLLLACLLLLLLVGVMRDRGEWEQQEQQLPVLPIDQLELSNDKSEMELVAGQPVWMWIDLPNM